MAAKTQCLPLLVVVCLCAPLPGDCRQGLEGSSWADPSGLAVHLDLVQQMASKLEALERKVARLEQNVTKSVAFYARTNRDPFDVGSQDIVILNDVITNVGQAYNENTGVFTTPYNGTYFFAYSVMNAPDHDAYIFVEVDGQRQTTDYVAHRYIMATAHITLRLKTGQTVYLLNLNDTQFRGGDYTTFSGFLIQAE